MLTQDVITGLMIPFIGTSAGGACVFFMKRELNISVQKALTGFAAGVMAIAASIPEYSDAIRSVEVIKTLPEKYKKLPLIPKLMFKIEMGKEKMALARVDFK